MFVAPQKGMESLVGELKDQLKVSSLQSGRSVSSVLQNDKEWRVVFSDGSTIDSDAVIICLPAHAAARLLKPIDSNVTDLLTSIRYTSSAVINFIVDRENILHRLDGFGFVVPAGLGRHILAASFSSVKFEGRAPANLVVLRAFVGGALFPEILELSDAQICQRAFADLSFYLSIKAPARGLAYKHAQITRWNDAMPQYAVGHRQKIKSIEAHVNALSGLFLCGAAYEGVGIPDCIRSANQAAESVFELLFQPVS
jgi:oxygen-dependent protoporphyrinogen oxidase